MKADAARLEVLNPVGEVIAELEGEKSGDEIRFVLDGTIAGIQYHLTVGENME